MADERSIDGPALDLGSQSTILLVKNLPTLQSENDVRKMLLHFLGPSGNDKSLANNEDITKDVDIRIMKGPKMANSAFITFPSRDHAANYKERIEKVDFNGKRLKVEYATAPRNPSSDTSGPPVTTSSSPTARRHEKQQKDSRIASISTSSSVPPSSKSFEPISSKFGLNYAPNPSLHYLYPPPNPMILTNIMYTIAAVPKLYTQVLHLMNKMNLPPPFGPIGVVPNMFRDTRIIPPNLVPLPTVGAELQPQTYIPHSAVSASLPQYTQVNDNGKKRKKRDELLASDESEIESSEDEGVKTKRPKIRDRIKAKSNETLSDSVAMQNTDKAYMIPPVPVIPHTVQAILPPTIEPAFAANPVVKSSVISQEIMQDASAGFGPSGLTQISDSVSEPTITDRSVESKQKAIEDWLDHCLSNEELQEGKATEGELNQTPAYKNYNRGDPSRTLFIKNLPKKASRQQLEWIFGRYYSNQDEMRAFVFRFLPHFVMMEGRMKGQAFVKFESQEKAEKILDEIFGFKLDERPMIVQFGKHS
ncbi:hypothetical protein BKA69DRAFT_1126982 [Paraphysoderma sedebokerense]|nr:hypothetical protein BKA69DRAFT_1126982 [Paraphysoderma sedebokerense]